MVSERDMRYSEAIKNGFQIINKSWQLVLIQIAALFVSFMGFFVIVGFPLAIAFIIFGLDFTEIPRFHDVLRAFHEPSALLSQYFWLVILVLTSALLYVLAVFSLGVFVFGGSIGVISHSMRERTEGFSMKLFLSQGKRLFFPLVGFTSVMGMIFVALAFVLGLFGGAIAALVSLAREQEATLALFLGIFFSLILLLVGLILILIALAVTLYGAAALAIEGYGPVRSTQASLRYLYKHAEAFYLYCIAFGGYIIISFLVFFLGYPLKFIPLIGPLFTVVLQFTIHVGQSYLGLVMLATIFWYYFMTEGGLGEDSNALKTADSLPTSENSTQQKDISESQAHGQEEALPEKGPQE
ncbi:MAG TPA: hypothetical protein DCP92_21995 [Nitrospiraceae bacterium]|jgi:hypothetical protein|nr:hypothetical protein [Nitrospiraceae bacterium]